MANELILRFDNVIGPAPAFSCSANQFRYAALPRYLYRRRRIGPGAYQIIEFFRASVITGAVAPDFTSAEKYSRTVRQSTHLSAASVITFCQGLASGNGLFRAVIPKTQIARAGPTQLAGV